MILDLAVSLALGGDCLADANLLRAEPGVFGRVASDPAISRTITALAGDVSAVLAAVDRGPGRRPGQRVAAGRRPDSRP